MTVTAPQPVATTSASAEPLGAWLAGNGLVEFAPIQDGRIHRVAHSCKPGASDAGWYWSVNEPVPYAVFGCWRCGASGKWVGVDRKLTREESEAVKGIAAAREREDEARKIAAADETRRAVQQMPLAAHGHPYLTSKGVKPHGAFQHPDGPLILPLIDVHGAIWSAQGIHNTAHAALGGRSKAFLSGGRLAGCFFPVGNVRGAQVVVICEGFATGATIYELTGIPVACAMSAGNLRAVAKAFRDHFPDTDIIIAADNDRHTEGNPGVAKAEAAALATNAAVVVPDFGDIPPASDATDFNDMARIHGDDVVRDIINGVRPPEKTRIFYECRTTGGAWWLQGLHGGYLPINESGAKRALKAAGLSASAEKGESISAVDAELHRIAKNQFVSYAGPVAGWTAGVHQMAGKRVLVTSSVQPVEAAPGDAERLGKIIGSMLGQEQTHRFMFWLHCARKRLVGASMRHPMPALILVGPKNCGKSLLQHVITRLLGGRSSNPMQYIMGETAFNGDMIGAEHLVIEDETSKTDAQSRMRLGERIKSLLYVRVQRCHPKNCPAIDLEPVWVMSMSLNDEEEHLQVLPRIDESLKDKILLLRCVNAERDVPPGVEENTWISSVLREELPQLAGIVDRYIPDASIPDMVDSRSGVAGWQNNEIVQVINGMSAEMRLLSFVDDTLFSGTVPPGSWTGTADQLSRDLRAGPYGREVERLLSWNTACGTYLARLSIMAPKRVWKAGRSVTDDGKVRMWTISAPEF